MREDRIARNEVLYRELNERVRQVESELSGRGVIEQVELGEYFCECGLDGCVEKVRLSSTEYEAVRANPYRFFVLPEHLIADVERIVEQNERFAVVEKVEGEREVAVRHDPRRQ